MPGLPSLSVFQKRKSDLLMLLKIIATSVVVDPLLFFKSPLSRIRKAKPRIDVSTVRTQDRSCLPRYRSLNCLLGESVNVIQMSLPVFRSFMYCS